MLENSTVTGNHARLAAGIYSSNDANNTVAITNSTIAGNVTDAEGGGAPSGPGAGLGIATGSVDIENSIVAGNVATASGVTVATNCAGSPGAVVSLGHNIESGSDCAFGSAGDLQNTDPLLGPLGAHGGPTETLAPGAGSKAINGGVPAGCTDLGGTAIVTDQRGISRPQGSACDIGAFEFRLPSMSGSPAVSGAGKVGQTLTCALPAVVSPDGAAQSTVTWLRDGTAVATGSTYGARTADARHTLSCSVSVSDAAGAVSATSAGVAITAAPRPRALHAPDGQAHRSPHHEETGDVHVHGDPCHQRPMRRLPASQVRALQALQVAADLPAPKRDRRVQGQGDRTGRHGQRGIRRSARRCQAGLVPSSPRKASIRLCDRFCV